MNEEGKEVEFEMELENEIEKEQVSDFQNLR